MPTTEELLGVQDVDVSFDDEAETETKMRPYEVLQDKQQLFMQSGAKYHLMGGAAGGGKSHAFRAKSFWSATYRKKVKGIIFRRTLPEIKRNFVDPFREEVSNRLFRYNENQNRIKFINGSYIDLAYCERESDLERYRGLEYDFVGIEEITQWTYKEFRLIARLLRSSKEGIRPFLFGTCNPGGIGHAWVKRLFINRQFEGKEKPEDYEMVRAFVRDNRFLDPEYIDALQALDETNRRALLDGDWDVFEGQYFTEYREEIHVCPPTVPVDVKRRVIAIDYGYKAPACVLWGAQDTQGRVWVYRELYLTGHTYQQLAQRIAAMTGATEQIHDIVCDPAALTKKAEDTGITMQDEFIRVGKMVNCQWLGKVHAADNARLEGWNNVRKFMRPFKDPNTGNITALLKIGRNCENLIRTLPEQIHDKTNVEDVNTKGEDHAPDTLRYLLKEFGINISSLKDVEPLNRLLERSTKIEKDDVEIDDRGVELEKKGDPQFWKPEHRDDSDNGGSDILGMEF